MGIEKEVADLNYRELLSLRSFVEDRKADNKRTVRTTG